MPVVRWRTLNASMYAWHTALALVCSLAGCGNGEPPPPTLPSLHPGWVAFEAEDHVGAMDEFRFTLSIDPSNADAHLGLGWSLLFLDSLSVAEGELAIAHSSGLDRPEDAFCGLAVARLGMEEFLSTIQAADSVLSLDPAYVFTHRSTIDFLDVHLVRAEACIHEGDLISAQESMDVIDPSNILDPAEPSTWIVDGRSYSIYEEALIAELERVRRLASL